MSTDELEENIITWLTKTGYPLEMRVAALLGSAKVSATHNRVFKDSSTGKIREIDVVGYFDHSNLSVHLVFECKHAHGKPWVILCTRTPIVTARGYPICTPSTPKAGVIMRRLADNETVQRMSMFNKPSLVGFRLIRALNDSNDNKDPGFCAVSGLASACRSTAEDIGQHGHSVVYVPVIVIDTPLFYCHLPDAIGGLKVAKATRGLSLHTFEPGELVVIHVVHIDALADFVADVKRDPKKRATLTRSSQVDRTQGSRRDSAKRRGA